MGKYILTRIVDTGQAVPKVVGNAQTPPKRGRLTVFTSYKKKSNAHGALKLILLDSSSNLGLIWSLKLLLDTGRQAVPEAVRSIQTPPASDAG